MSMNARRIICLVVVSCTFLLFAIRENALAVPSFARQTGLACNICHTVFPDLTSFGRAFKAGGFTQSEIKKIKSADTRRPDGLEINDVFPVSVMVQAALTSTKKNQPDTQNDNVQFPQQFSLFLAGEITPHIGSFIQITYTQTDDHITMDNTDIRYARMTELAGKQLYYGLTLNNNPTVEDLWSSTPAWGYPTASADTAPTPSAGAQIDGALGQQVAGLGAYGFWDNQFYAAAAVYRSAQIGESSPPSEGDNESTIKNVAPYWRLAWQKEWGNNMLQVGTYGLYARLYPDSSVSGNTDEYTDIAFDATYELRFGNDLLSIRGTHIYERQKLNATYDDGGSSNRSNDLNTLRADAGYYLDRLVGFTLGYFELRGDKDHGLYDTGERVTGSDNGSPDSKGLIGEISYYPWENVRVSAQYTWYDTFNGRTDDYDGFGRDADDNNTLYLLVWLAW
jgi:hypothetical protein